jgi:hypothetical protein
LSIADCRSFVLLRFRLPFEIGNWQSEIDNRETLRLRTPCGEPAKPEASTPRCVYSQLVCRTNYLENPANSLFNR